MSTGQIRVLAKAKKSRKVAKKTGKETPFSHEGIQIMLDRLLQEKTENPGLPRWAFWQRNLDGKMPYSSFSRHCNNDPRIKAAFDIAKTGYDEEQEARKHPGPGILWYKEDAREGGAQVYTCGCKIPPKLVEPGTMFCPRCNTDQQVWKKQQEADNCLLDILRATNNATSFSWPDAEEFHAEDLLQLVKSTCFTDNAADTELLQFLDQMDSFKAFFVGKRIRVRCKRLTWQDCLTIDEPDRIKGGFCPSGYVVRPQQAAANPSDGSFGLIVQPNGDFSGIGSLEDLCNDTIVQLSREETEVMQQLKYNKRAGAAGGFPTHGTSCKSHDSCKAARETAVRYKCDSFSTCVTMKYINNDGKVQSFKSLYGDLVMTRLTASQKRARAMQQPALRKKILAEMKSRFDFLMILVQYRLGDKDKLFKTFAHAARSVMKQWTIRKPKKRGTTTWTDADSRLTLFDMILLEWACRTGEMRNHQGVSTHKDGNSSHPVESMTLFGKVEDNDVRSSTEIVNNSMVDGFVILPYHRFAWKMRCGRDVLHSSFKKTYHLPDPTRGWFNWSWVHGP